MANENVKQLRGGPRRGMRIFVSNPRKLFSRLMKYILKKYTLHLIVVVCCIITSVIANVQGTMFTKTLIDGYIQPMLDTGSTDFAPLKAAIGRVALFYGVGVASALLQSIIMIYVTQGTMLSLREELFSHMEKLPIRYFDTHAHGDIMSVYTNDIDTLRQMVSQSLPQIFNSFITIVSIISMMIALSPALTGVTLIMIFLMFFITSRLTRISGRGFAEQQSNLGAMNGFIEEMISGQKVVKVFGHESENIRAFDELNERLFQSSFRANAASLSVMPVNGQLGNISYVLCSLVGGLLALNSYAGFTVGALASFLTFNKNFNMPITQISTQFNSIMMALAGADRLFSLLDEAPEQDEGYVTLVNCREKADGSGLEESDERTGRWAWKHFHKADGTTDYVPLSGDVTFNDVDFGYDDTHMVLHNIVLHALPGQKIALVGSTGAGKTTITNLINRFYDIQDGKIRYDNININKIQKGDLRRSLGMVLQDTHLFTLTVKENIRYGRLDATDEEVYAAARLANADSFIRRLPEGYDTVLTGDGANLSQGQRQLLSIARAAIADPPVLILDEATSSIDTRTEKIVQDGMDRLMHGRTTFVIAHRLSTVKNSDCIIVMEGGRIIEQGNHEELIARKGRYYQLYTGSAAASSATDAADAAAPADAASDAPGPAAGQ